MWADRLICRNGSGMCGISAGRSESDCGGHIRCACHIGKLSVKCGQRAEMMWKCW